MTKEQHQAEWIAETERRFADLDTGQVESVPVDQVFRKIKERKQGGELGNKNPRRV